MIKSLLKKCRIFSCFPIDKPLILVYNGLARMVYIFFLVMCKVVAVFRAMEGG